MTKKRNLPGFYWREDKNCYEHPFTMNKKRYSVYGKTVKECREKEAAKRRQIEEESYIRNHRLTMDKYFPEWMAYKAQSISEGTADSYARTYRIHISPVFGKRKLKDIERREVIQFQGELHKTFKTETVEHIMQVLKQLMASAVRDEVLVRNVCEGIPAVKRRPDEKPARETIHKGPDFG